MLDAARCGGMAIQGADVDRELIIRLAVQAGITPWAKNEWSKDRFVQTDEGMDGDACV